MDDDDKLIELDKYRGAHENSTENASASTPSTSQVVVDTEGNGSISLEVPQIDHSDIKKRTSSTVDPDKVDIAKPIRILKRPREIKLKITVVLLFCLIIASTTCILVFYVEEPLHYKVGDAVFYAVSREFDVHFNGANITRGLIGRNLPDMLPSSCDPFDSRNLCLEYTDIAKLLIHWEQLSGVDCYNLTWEAFSHDLVHRDCYSFENIHWYGGSVSANQQWPLEKMNLSRAPFVSGHKASSFGPVVERFWIASHGVGIMVNDESPLFVSINEDGQKLCFESTYHDSPFPNPNEELPKLQYTLCAAVDMPSVHQKMTNKFSKKPHALPHQALSKSPMWSVPACYRENAFNETMLLEFATAIYNSSLGAKSLEIPCDYMTSEGDLAFDAMRFPSIATTLAQIQEFGLDVGARVTLFMSTNSEAFLEGLQHQYLVEDPRSQVPGLTKWKEGVAGLLDVTSTNATAWFRSRLKSLQSMSGVGFFTFDYGQVSYLPVEFQTVEDLRNPCTFTERYVELANETNSPVIVRSAFQSQDIPVIMQTIPKTSVWGYENGLKSVIPTALTLSILGYPFIMPDLEVRGLHYDPSCSRECLPSKEFLLRWLGIISFLPAMKINIPIWEYDQETVSTTDKFIKFHQETIAPLVLQVAMEAGNTTAAVIRPLWWIASTDPVAQSIDSEFLIGNDMLVAPVLDPGLLKRQVYLPEGKWADQLHGTTLDGGAWVEVDALLDQVPYFTRTTFSMLSKRRIIIAVVTVVLLCAVAAGVICAVVFTVGREDPPATTSPISPPAIRTVVDVEAATGKVAIKNLKGNTVLSGTLAASSPTNVNGLECFAEGNRLCYVWKDTAEVNIELVASEEREDSPFTCAHIVWESMVAGVPLRDCYSLNGAHWYGSAEMFYQLWPIEKWNETTTMYVSGDMYANWQDYGSVLDRYWLSSRGVAIRASHDTPLHVSLNNDDDSMVCFQSTYANSYYPNPENNLQRLDYTVCTHDDVRQVHDAVWREMGPSGGKPEGLPDERMIKSPIWSTWARYKIFINDSVVNAYADEITSNGFNNSQIEIDDGYSFKYGEFDFDLTKFPNMRDTVQKLHDKGFRVTLWVTPFANTDTDAYQEGKEKGYWVTKRGQDEGVVKWWNGLAGMLDVTNPEAVEWFVGRLEKLKQDTGIDSFKFDAGETNYLVEDFQTYSPLVNPSEYTNLHSKMAARLGSQIEVRAAFENQNLPIFVRMMDKDSRWGWDNGLKTLITTALTFSVLGYPYILPDMIGGNSYETEFHGLEVPPRELYIRWLEITAFMPAMQFSISPWQYDDEVVRISRKWVSFHENFITPKLLDIARSETIVKPGQPLLRPLWWIAPTDEVSLKIDTEFLVGDDLLVAPIVNNATYSRDIYLPPADGLWKYMPQGNTLEGGQWLIDVPVPLDEAAYFILEKFS
ncbi:uncharacterized protein LOC110988061 [Acanthaster planci]|uniref:Uncharacterized protein LOC110988061 n=1 Tax=Acanthaster planci TaxID=133434 RepID=A0A8B7ZNH7_ACAPL|nr:uncharacterized protein LOC110988061 [Acanthaster planci]